MIETERLVLRPHEPQDLDAFCAMEMDPDVRRFVGGRPRTRDEAEARFSALLHPGRFPFCAMIFKPDMRYIGRCGLHAVPGAAVGLGFYVAKDFWGRGFATEAARAFVEHGFRDLKLKRIVSSVERGNRASARVLEKLGFRLVRHEPGERRSFDHFELTAAPSLPATRQC